MIGCVVSEDNGFRGGGGAFDDRRRRIQVPFERSTLIFALCDTHKHTHTPLELWEGGETRGRAHKEMKEKRLNSFKHVSRIMAQQSNAQHIYIYFTMPI